MRLCACSSCMPGLLPYKHSDSMGTDNACVQLPLWNYHRDNGAGALL